jgi:hypothetical protein
MGKIFYGSHADKEKAQIQADTYARAYKKGVCYTPSSRIPNACKFDAAKGVWTCYSAAHHHYGSCGTYEITRTGNGTEWSISIPVITWGPLAAPGTEKSMSPAATTGGAPGFVPEQGDETYEDAAPEDYAPLDG